MMQSEFTRPILGFVAYSGSGKTTLLEQLIPALRSRGLRIALIKHAHHDFDIDIPGKDSYRLRKAGASQVMVASASRWALINEHDEQHDEPQLEELLQHLDCSRFDLLLVEGFKHESHPKIEVWRSATGKPLIYPTAENIIALACDQQPKVEVAIPLLDLNNVEAITDYIMARVATQSEASEQR
jgi:molybdopterin-guanine dinucleotide biosynthesis protein MobB